MAKSRDMRPHGTAGPSADGTFLDFLGIVAQVSDTPEEPEDGAPGPEEGGESGQDGFESPQRGWIDPDDRLWRHPSEVAGPGPAPDFRFPLDPPSRHNYRSAVMVLVGVGAVMAVVALVIVLLSPACASFDQFKSFEERGRAFKEIVQKNAKV